MTQEKQFFKIFTHDFKSPLQGGDVTWDGSLPFDLPKVRLDTSDTECGAGWNFVDSIATGFRIAGMWPAGRPSIVALVEPGGDAIQRKNKWRSSTLRIRNLASESQIAIAIEEFSQVFKPFESDIAFEQLQWRYALGRPENKEAAVVEGLKKALAHRGLKWTVKRYEDARAAWDAWAAWDARDARDAWAARAAWAARDAWAALSVFYASKKEWIKQPADLLTVGIRDAYQNGLEITVPTGEHKLGYVMAKR